MKLYVYPPSMFSQKVLVACYEKGIEFSQENVNLFDTAAYERFVQLGPWGRLPLLVTADNHMVAESSIIIEYLDLNFTEGTKLLPADRKDALAIRYYDRVFDYFFIDPLARIFHASHKPTDAQSIKVVGSAHEQLDDAFAWMNEHLAGKQWLGGSEFSLADCASAPALNRSCVVYPFDRYANVVAYWGRLSKRASFIRMAENVAAYLNDVGDTVQ
ncbi:MAG: glutathione S-transferase [Blastocatellia bacterium]|jgi:glutathione S-transferase|nr:glutathione S-transferase [Blastocatellia bacterium]